MRSIDACTTIPIIYLEQKEKPMIAEDERRKDLLHVNSSASEENKCSDSIVGVDYIKVQRPVCPRRREHRT